ncbi:MAG: c-type cytochrome [Thermoanaerobaculia bacterium]
MRRTARIFTLLFAFLGVLAAAAAVMFVARGISARAEPSPLEVRLARAARHLLIPAQARALTNPVAGTSDAIASAMAHFADHCALCHGNDGRGRTYHGGRMFPRAPDMTAAATQSLADGELFWIIEHGVRLTGMPGFGDDDPANDTQSWELVLFLRHLPAITAEELAEMQRLNPMLSRADVARERSDEEFLAGSAPATTQKRP